jgi:hypothetical protein
MKDKTDKDKPNPAEVQQCQGCGSEHCQGLKLTVEIQDCDEEDCKETHYTTEES